MILACEIPQKDISDLGRNHFLVPVRKIIKVQEIYSDSLFVFRTYVTVTFVTVFVVVFSEKSGIASPKNIIYLFSDYFLIYKLLAKSVQSNPYEKISQKYTYM